MPTIRGRVKNTTASNLRKYNNEMLRKVRNLVQDSITKVEIMAVRDAPPFVNIDKRITDGGMTGQVGVMGSDPLAAYFEFGTGLSAVDILSGYPQWVKDIAWEFYVNGRGTLTGKPYLFNNFLVVEEEFKRELKQIIDEQVNDN